MMRNVNLSYQLIACFFIYLPIFVFTLLIKLTLLLQNKLFGFLIIAYLRISCFYCFLFFRENFTAFQLLPYRILNFLEHVLTLSFTGLGIRFSDILRRPVLGVSRGGQAHSHLGFVRWQYDQRITRAHGHSVQPCFQRGRDASCLRRTGQQRKDLGLWTGSEIVQQQHCKYEHLPGTNGFVVHQKLHSSLRTIQQL